jgi:outer membrane protein assembly factor BamB
VSSETKLTRSLPPALVWEMPKGEGYVAPAIAGDRLVFLHRLKDEEVVQCLHPETGARQWEFRYATAYQDRYGYNNGPRSSPVIEGTRVYTTGAEGKLHCLDLASGKLVWKRDLRADYKVPQDFFGTASTPLVEGTQLIVNVGAPNGPCVVSLDLATGKEVWRAGTKWGPSYASPVPATMHGQRRVFVFAGGESEPPTGGLLSINPANGRIDFEFPWRSRSFESVNASCPVVFDNKVFISASYRTGSGAAGDQARLLPPCRLDDAGVRVALQHRAPITRGFCTGSTAATNRTRRWPASMQRPAASSGGKRPNGQTRSVRRSRWSAPTVVRCCRWTAATCVSVSSGIFCGSISRRPVTSRSPGPGCWRARVMDAAGAEPWVASMSARTRGK